MTPSARRGTLITAVALLTACSAAATHPTDTKGSLDTKAKQCLSVARIYRTEIVDDSTILFHMRDGAVWRNLLANPCYGLRMQGGFGYTTSLDRLCDRDLIQVLGPSRSVCGLGRFEPSEPPEGPGANAYDAE